MTRSNDEVARSVEPLRGIHHILDTSPPTAQMCIDLLVTYFGADQTLDPGGAEPLPVRLAALGPSIIDEPQRRRDRTIHFELATEHVVDGQPVRFYDGARAGDHRYAYLVDQPELQRWHCRWRGGWVAETPTSVLDHALSKIIDRLEARAASAFVLRWTEGQEPPDDERQTRRERIYSIAREMLSLHCQIPLFDLSPALLIGTDIVVKLGAKSVWVSGPDDEAVLATGLMDIDGVAGFTATVWAKSKSKADASGAETVETTATTRRRAEISELRAWLSDLPALMPLDRLGAVAWDRLEHAYGSAGDVPAWLEALSTAHDLEYPAGLDPLYGAVAHQGSLYSATPFIVPFLGTILESRPDLRQQVLSYVQHITVPFQESCFPAMTGSIPEADDAMSLEGFGEYGTAVTVARLWPTLARLASTDDAATVRHAVCVLSGLPNRAQETFELVRQLQPPPGALSSTLLALGIAGRHLGAAAGDLAQLTDLEHHELPSDVHFARAVARCLLGDTTVRSQLMSHIGTKYPPLSHWCSGKQFGLTTATLATIEGWPSVAETAAVSAALLLPRQDKVSVVEAVTPKVFPNSYPARVTDLNEQQRIWLEGISAVFAAQQANVTFANLDNAIGMSKIGLARYLAGDFDPTL